MTSHVPNRMTNIPENLVKFQAGTWWVWRAGHRIIPLLCHGFVRRNKAKTEGFKLTFVWLNSDGVLVKVHPKWPARLEPLPAGEGSFDWEPPADAVIRYRPFAGPDEYMQFADLWLKYKIESSIVAQRAWYKPVEINYYGIRLSQNEEQCSWARLLDRFEFIAGPWKPVGMPIGRKR